MSNLTRPIYVEGLVSLLLGNRWKYLGDWDGWDLERDDGKRLEVKQSAARQPWTDRPGGMAVRPSPISTLHLAKDIGLMAASGGCKSQDGMPTCSSSHTIRS